MGNHDLPLGADRVRAELERVGITVSRNEAHLIEYNGSWLAIAGIDDTVVGNPHPLTSLCRYSRTVCPRSRSGTKPISQKKRLGSERSPSFPDIPTVARCACR